MTGINLIKLIRTYLSSYDKSKLYLPKMQEGIKCIFSRKIEGKSRLVPLVVILLVNTMLVLL